MRKKTIELVTILFIVIFCVGASVYFFKLDDKVAKKDSTNSSSSDMKTARIVANGDILYHDVLYMSADKGDGTYDFDSYFEYAKPWIEGADLALGDFEGTISDKHPLSGYPFFNAPKETAVSMKNTGYDVVDLAHNHILDSGIYGLKYTAKTFKDLGLDVVGVHPDKPRSEDGMVIKEVNGIKIAILAYAYGYNGLESNLTKEQYNSYLSDLDEDKIKADLEKAEKEADVTVVMPQMGEEYRLTPTEEQKKLYHKMISWGADVILGGHPHVVEPAETVEKDGEKKFIIYSMGNFISNQRAERMGQLGLDKNVKDWPERGLLMDVTFEKNNNKTIIKTVKAHPTLVQATPKNKRSKEGYELFDYRVLVLEDFIEGGKNRDKLDETMKKKVDLVYKEMNEHVGLKW